MHGVHVCYFCASFIAHLKYYNFNNAPLFLVCIIFNTCLPAGNPWSRGAISPTLKYINTVTEIDLCLKEHHSKKKTFVTIYIGEVGFPVRIPLQRANAWNCWQLCGIAGNCSWIEWNCRELQGVYRVGNCMQVKSTCIGNPKRKFKWDCRHLKLFKS